MIVISCFCFFVTFVLSLITNCLFLSGFKINRINPHLVIISSKLPAITNVIHKSVADYFTCCNIHVTQHYCTMLATATGNCAVET